MDSFQEAVLTFLLPGGQGLSCGFCHTVHSSLAVLQAPEQFFHLDHSCFRRNAGMTDPLCCAQHFYMDFGVKHRFPGILTSRAIFPAPDSVPRKVSAGRLAGFLTPLSPSLEQNHLLPVCPHHLFCVSVSKIPLLYKRHLGLQGVMSMRSPL